MNTTALVTSDEERYRRPQTAMHEEATEAGASRFSSEPFRASLRRLMEERGLSFRQLAYKTKLSPGYLNHLSKGKRVVPSNDVLEVIARALHVEPDYFREYRVRYVIDVLDESPALLAAVYEALLQSRTGEPDGADRGPAGEARG